MKHLNLNKQMDDLDQIISNDGEFKNGSYLGSSSLRSYTGS